MPEVKITGIAAKQMTEPDSADDVWFATKATVTNGSNNALEVQVILQAVDSDGFELKTVPLGGELNSGETKVLSDRTFMPYQDFLAIASWQIKSASAYEP